MKRGLEEEGKQITAWNSCRRRAQWPCYLGRETTPLTQHRGGRGASDSPSLLRPFTWELWLLRGGLGDISAPDLQFIQGCLGPQEGAPSSPFHPTHLPYGSGRQSLHPGARPPIPGARPPTHFGFITNWLCLVTTVSLRSVSSSVKWR